MNPKPSKRFELRGSTPEGGNYPPSTIFAFQLDSLHVDKRAKIQRTLEQQRTEEPRRPTPWGTPRASTPPAELSPVFTFLARVRGATTASDPDDGLDLIYHEIDALLREGAFPQVDAILSAVDMTLPVVYLLAFVSITSAARVYVAWKPFLDRVRQHLSRVEPERVEELLRGFE